ncbi:MAG TPA: GIY-YIG nuclease family protein [Candidatus Peribacterales bacterium]|nr:GIY-YIG nuclease family protein [Candidatus Peribacterales bacterium]
MAKKPFYLYMIECSNGTYYTGTTNDIERRWQEHQQGSGSNYTHKYHPKQLVLVKEYQSIDLARAAEQKIKKWSQAKKRKLISGEWG